jgi:lysophospholipase L1-like esterase
LYWIFIHSRDDPFEQPLCDPSTGECHETPYIASPRTAYSAWNKQQFQLWWKFHYTLNQRAKEYATRRKEMKANNNDENVPRPLILLGDSITESWMGTGMGQLKERAKGVHQVLEDELSMSHGLDPLVLAISGDQTQHLLWRLQNGQLLPEYANDPVAVFVILIGTNNLGAGELPEPTAQGIASVVDHLLKHTSEHNHIMLMHVLPRGDGKTWLQNLCPPRCNSHGQPFKSFMPIIPRVNAMVEEFLPTGATKDKRLSMVDCGTDFLNTELDGHRHGQEDGSEVKEELMPDLLHPNAAGHKVLAKCIRDYINKL